MATTASMRRCALVHVIDKTCARLVPAHCVMACLVPSAHTPACTWPAQGGPSPSGSSQERKLGQKFRMDVVLDTDLRKAGRTDDLQHTINYAAVYQCAVGFSFGKGEEGRGGERGRGAGGFWASRSRPLMPAEPTRVLARRCREIEKVVTGAPCQLLERVAERVASQIMVKEPLVSAVRVEILKPHVAVSGVVEGLGISIHRTRDEMHAAGVI